MGNNHEFDQDGQHQANKLTDSTSEPVKQAEKTEASPQSLRERVLESLSQHAHDDGHLTDSPVSSATPEAPEPLAEQKGTEAPLVQAPTELIKEQDESDDIVSTNMSREEYSGSDMSTRQKESRRRKAEREKESSVVKKIVAVVIISLLIIMAVLGISFYRYWQAGLKPLDTSSDQLKQVEIPIGTSNKGIGAILEKDKIIKSGLVFTYFVKTNNLTDFRGGFYQMAPNMTLDEIGEMLKLGGTEEPEALADAHLTIPEGHSIDQIAEIFAKKTPVTKEAFLEAVNSEALFKKLVKAYPQLLADVKDNQGIRYPLEGYLFPATYNYYKESTVDEMITQMVAKADSVLSTKQEDIAATKLTTQQVLTLASLVEREGVEESDRRNIAQVFLNRIAVDMPLQSDISILYAMDEHKVHLSNKDTEIDSPYNLYVNKGFGPGPFNNPSEQAIDAVLHPEPNDYIYFLADVTTHKVYFAKTYDEHLKLKEEYIDNKQ